MTVPARGDGAAAGESATAAGHEPEQLLVPRHPPARLVRIGGRWLCDHQLAGVSPSDGPSHDVQLRS
jgi:hypothetical protein